MVTLMKQCYFEKKTQTPFITTIFRIYFSTFELFRWVKFCFGLTLFWLGLWLLLYLYP